MILKNKAGYEGFDLKRMVPPHKNITENNFKRERK